MGDYGLCVCLYIGACSSVFKGLKSRARAFNPRTYKVIHNPTLVQAGRGGWNPLLVFAALQYFEKILPLMDSL